MCSKDYKRFSVRTIIILKNNRQIDGRTDRQTATVKDNSAVMTVNLRVNNKRYFVIEIISDTCKIMCIEILQGNDRLKCSQKRMKTFWEEGEGYIKEFN